jgi:tetratricopeptide (TPR) repeat protein
MLTLALLSLLLVQDVPAPGAATGLTAVRHLYAAASYEEALARLETLEQASGAEPAQLEQYRALCLLGLGRTEEAQQSLERMVTGTPLYTIHEADVSPRLVAMFRDIRKRLLPDTARTLYARGKASFDRKQYTAASAAFTELLSILADPDMSASAAALADMKMLAEGFQQLAEAEVASEAKARAEAQARARAAAVSAAPVTAAMPVVPAVYADTDTDVTPPVDIERRMPSWNPPTQLARTIQYRGVLEIVISERGTVDSAILRDSVAAFYDDPLLAAAMDWRFRPATRNGTPVKYRKLLEIVHSPR